MNTIHVIAKNFVGDDLTPNLGGVESYLRLLESAVRGIWRFRVYQESKEPFHLTIEGIEVVGLGRKSLTGIVSTLEVKWLNGDDVLLFSTDQYCAKTGWLRTAVIQHGVSWDLPTELLTARRVPLLIERPYRLFLVIRNHRRVLSMPYVICVDYNYLNWYNTFATRADRRKRFMVIPSCAGPQFFKEWDSTSGQGINICFPRRFLPLRGFGLFLDVAKGLLARHKEVSITFIGVGGSAELGALEDLMGSSSRVEVRNLGYDEMPLAYAAADIVVIPSLGSEGSTLAALEAMAMGKCVVATHVGGLTNILINGHNGYLVAPNSAALSGMLSELIENPGEIRNVGERARLLARHAFAFETWKKRWLDALASIDNSKSILPNLPTITVAHALEIEGS